MLPLGDPAWSLSYLCQCINVSLRSFAAAKLASSLARVIRATLHGDRARLFESSTAIAAAIDQAQLENLNTEAALRRHAHEASSRALLEDRLSCADRIRVQNVESGRPGAERRSPKRDGESENATRGSHTSSARPA